MAANVLDTGQGVLFVKLNLCIYRRRNWKGGGGGGAPGVHASPLKIS